MGSSRSDGRTDAVLVVLVMLSPAGRGAMTEDKPHRVDARSEVMSADVHQDVEYIELDGETYT